MIAVNGNNVAGLNHLDNHSLNHNRVESEYILDHHTYINNFTIREFPPQVLT